MTELTIEQRLEKLETALSWYADPSVYRDCIDDEPIIMVDDGALARAALAQTEAQP